MEVEPTPKPSHVSLTVCLGEISNNQWSINPGPAGTAKSTGSDPPWGIMGVPKSGDIVRFFISSGLLAVSQIAFDDPFALFFARFHGWTFSVNHAYNWVTFRRHDTLAVTCEV